MEYALTMNMCFALIFCYEHGIDGSLCIMGYYLNMNMGVHSTYVYHELTLIVILCLICLFI